MKSSKLILASVATLLCIATGAQEKGSQREKKPGREELAVRQAEHICAELALDDKTCARFKEVYQALQKEVWELHGKCGKKSGNCGEEACRKNRAQMTEDEVRKELEDSFDRSQKMLDLRKKYYNEYSKFLTYKQIARVYEIEKEMMCARGKGGASRKGEAFGKPGFQKNPGDQRRNGAGNKADGRPNRQ